MSSETNAAGASPQLDITPTEKVAIDAAITDLHAVHSLLCGVGHILYALNEVRYNAQGFLPGDLFGDRHVQENISIAVAAVNEVLKLLRTQVLKEQPCEHVTELRLSPPV